MKIGDSLREISRPERLDPNKKYKLLGVKWYGKGMFLREEKLGKEIKSTTLYQVKAGDFIYNRLFAWKASFAIVPQEFDGCYVSNEFPMFIRQKGNIIPEFLLNYILLPQNIYLVNNLSGGMSSVSRKRFKESEFLSFQIPDYEIEYQERICRYLNRFDYILKIQDTELENQLSILTQIRQRILQEAIEGKLTVKWRTENPELVNGDNHASKLLEKIKAEKEWFCLHLVGKSF